VGRHGHDGTELNDLTKDFGLPSAFLFFARDARLFARDRTWEQRHAKIRQAAPLAPDELFHPPVPADLVVRRGMLRVTEFLPDGREVTRAVLQAGATFQTRAAAPAVPPDSGPDLQTGQGEIYDLAATVLMSLGEVEIWILPPGTLVESPE
jgi:hypothetical protein